MAHPSDSVFLMRIEEVEDFDGKPALTATGRPGDGFDKIILFKANTPDEFFGERGNRAIGRSLFVRIANIREVGFSKFAVGQPYEFHVLGTIKSEENSHTKSISAKVHQGSNIADVNGGELYLESNALITGPGTVEITFNHEQNSFSANVVDYELQLPTTGDVIPATVPAINRKSTALVRCSSGRYRIRLDNIAPYAGDVEVEITDDSHPIRGKFLRFESQTPSKGDIVEANLKQFDETILVSHEGVVFNIDLPHEPLTTGDVKIRLTEIGQPMKGEIVSYSELPDVGDILTVSVTRQKGPASVSPTNEKYQIHLDENVLLDGKIDVQLTSGGPPYRGIIDSYRGQLPDVGDKVRAFIRRRPSGAYADPVSYSYRVVIRDETDYLGAAEVEITDVSNEEISGRILKEIDSQRKPNATSKNPFLPGSETQNDLINRKKL